MKSNALRVEAPELAGDKARGGQKRAKQAPKLVSEESLPPQLPRAEIDALIIAHTEHGERLARSFLNRWRVKMNPGEVTSVVGVALCEAANRFDITKGVSFKTFFFYHLRGMLIKEIIRLVDEQKVCQLSPQNGNGESRPADLSYAEYWPLPVVESRTPESLLQKNQLAQICWDVCGELDQLEQDVIIRFFVFDQPLNTIAKELGYCRCHISRVKSRALATLSKSLKDRLPDYKFSVLDHDLPDEAAEKPKDLASGKVRKYKGGRGRRKSANASGSADTTTERLAS